MTRQIAQGIHRHIGGLEKVIDWWDSCICIHRHIGGLEIDDEREVKIFEIHRHIGGLEKSPYQSFD